MLLQRFAKLLRIDGELMGRRVKFGSIDNVFLFGGGSVLLSVAETLSKKGVPTLVVTSPRQVDEILPETGNSFLHELRKLGFDAIITESLKSLSKKELSISPSSLGLSFGAAWIFGDSFIKAFSGRLLNFHGRRLPQDRGAAGVTWAILRSNRVGYCLVHQVDAGIDTGAIVKYREFFYPASCRIPVDFQAHYRAELNEFTREFLDDVWKDCGFCLTEQQEVFSTYWPRLSTEHQGFIDWSWSLADIERFICAFDAPFAGASTFINGDRVHLRACFADRGDGSFHPFQTGIVYRKSPQAIYVAVGSGSLLIRNVVTPEEEDYIARIRLGDRFYTPTQCLDEARRFRAVITSRGLDSSN
jgi:methionyl-tRNA formyltransferase